MDPHRVREEGLGRFKFILQVFRGPLIVHFDYLGVAVRGICFDFKGPMKKKG